MKRLIATAFLALLFGILIYNIMEASEVRQPENKDSDLKTGQQAPDFKLETLAGETVKLSDYRGKKVFINFWATWCGPCKEEMPAIQQFHQKNGGDVVVLAVNALNTELDGRKKVSDFVTKNELTFPVLLDKKGKTLERYQVTHMPTTYFIGSDGKIQQPPHRGAMDEKFMKKMAQKLN